MTEEQISEKNSMTNWIKENTRIIISIIIVIAIAGGIYSYSKRSQKLIEQNVIEEQTVLPKDKVEIQKDEVQKNPSDNTVIQEPEREKSAISPSAASKETETSFIEVAEKGNGTTHLARRALANYLEKNPDSSLTAEHKIYIEDYLRKKSGFKGKIYIGTSVEFSKDLIKQAIDESKKLNEKQLKNLQKYTILVPSLS